MVIVLRSCLLFVFTICFGFACFIPVSKACIQAPTLIAKNECGYSFGFDNYQDSKVVLSVLDLKKEECGLSTEDKEILFGYIAAGYSVMEQNETEYAGFLDEVKKNNAKRPINCWDYSALHHNGRWTAYIKTGKNYLETGECVEFDCENAEAAYIWNDLKTPKKEAKSNDNIEPVLTTAKKSMSQPTAPPDIKGPLTPPPGTDEFDVESEEKDTEEYKDNKKRNTAATFFILFIAIVVVFVLNKGKKK